MDNFSQGARQPMSFVLSVMGLMGAFIGLFVGPAFGSALIGMIFGAVILVMLSYVITVTEYLNPKYSIPLAYHSIFNKLINFFE